MNPLLIGGAAAGIGWLLLRDKANDGGNDGAAGSASDARVPDPSNPLPTNTGTQITAEIISKLERGEEPIEKKNETSKDAVTYILKTLGMEMPLKEIESRAELSGALESYKNMLAQTVPALKDFDFTGHIENHRNCVYDFATWKGNISFLPKFNEHNPFGKPQLDFKSSGANAWIKKVRDYFWDPIWRHIDKKAQLFPSSDARIPVQYSYSMPVGNIIQSGKGELQFYMDAKGSVCVADDIELKLVDSFVISPAEVLGKMNTYIKDTAYETADYMMSLGLKPETALAALLAWLVNWSETFGAFDLRNPVQTGDSPLTYGKVSCGGYDILRYMQEKTNDDGDAFLFRQFSRYAAMFRHISFKAFCVANKEIGKKMIECLTKEDIEYNPNLDAILKELA